MTRSPARRAAWCALMMTAVLAPMAHAEIRLNQLRLINSQATSTSAFVISTPFATSVNGTPWIGFTNSISKTHRLSSLFRFERSIKGVTRTLAGDGNVYVVRKGQWLTEATLRSGELTPLDARNDAVVVGREFWLGVALKPLTPEGYDPVTPYAEFAWARVRFNTQGVPELLESVTAIQEAGLIVGERTPCSPCQTAAP